VTWTSQATGTDSIQVVYNDTGGQFITADARMTWNAKPVPSPTPTRRRPSPTPSPTASPTASATASPTASPTPSPTPTATPSPVHSAVVPSPTPSVAESAAADRPSTLPGGPVGLHGNDCPPGAPVAFTMEGAALGSTTAGSDGSYAATVDLPDASIGHHEIQVVCGNRRATVPIDLVVTASESDPGVGATVAAVLVFFVLLGGALTLRSGTARRRVTQ
jgi:hypothetical protein